MNSYTKKKYDKIKHRNYYAKDLNENFRKRTGAFKKRRNELREEDYEKEIKDYAQEEN